MDSMVYLIHAGSDSEWAGKLRGFLRACADRPPLVESIQKPGKGEQGEALWLSGLKSALAEASHVIALVTPEALADTRFAFELGVASALASDLVALVDPRVDPEYLTPYLRSCTLAPLDKPRALIGLARTVCENYAESPRANVALRRLLGEEDDEPASEQPSRSSSGSSTLQGIPAVRPEESLVALEHSSGMPTAEASFQGGFAISDCLFNKESGSSFARELDPTFGVFMQALGGNWSELREIEDPEVWSGATDNLLSSLPTALSSVVHWYELGQQVSTMLNVASLAMPDDRQQEEGILVARWQNALEALRRSAAALEIAQDKIAALVSDLKNLGGSESEKRYSTAARLRATLHQQACQADQEES